VLGKSLGFLLVKHLPVPAIFGWDSCCDGVVFIWWGEGDSSHIDLVGCRSSWYFAGSWDECGSFCIWSLEDNRELSVIDPSSIPIDLWLSGCEPRVP